MCRGPVDLDREASAPHRAKRLTLKLQLPCVDDHPQTRGTADMEA